MYSEKNVEQIRGDAIFIVRPRLEWLDYNLFMVKELEQFGKKMKEYISQQWGGLSQKKLKECMKMLIN